MSGRKRKSKDTTNPDNATGNDEGAPSGEPYSKKKSKKPKTLDPKKFGGMSEEEVMKLTLPDHLKPNLDIIFIGINPGLYSAYIGHHYSNANNHFWPCLFESGLVPKKMSYQDDAECLNYGIGFTNIVPRTTRGSDDLSRQEMKEWSKIMLQRMAELKPLVLCFNGKGIYEIYRGKKCEIGIQEERLPGTDTVVYVMPSTSGRAASYPSRQDKLKFFYELKTLRDRLMLQKGRQNIEVSQATTTCTNTEAPTICTNTEASTANTEAPITCTSTEAPTTNTEISQSSTTCT